MVDPPSDPADAKISEPPGAHDHSLVSRFTARSCRTRRKKKYASVQVPHKATTVEGDVSTYFYVAPKEQSALEVFRNYQAALKGAGFACL